MSTIITTSFLNIEDCNDQLIKYLVSLINTVYNTAENGLWIVNDSRVNYDQLIQLIKKKEILIAKNSQTIVGLIAISHISYNTTGFSMLSTHQKHQGKGIGSILVTASENWAKKNGASQMQLELLIPKEYTNNSKSVLTKWYTKIGYKIIRTEPFEITYPEKAKLLACECDFTIWQKSLL